MSYYEEEYKINEYLAEIQIYHDIKQEAKSKIWTTKDGTKIAVKDMTDSHIRNTINWIKRKDKYDYYLPWIKVFEEELTGREDN